MKRPIAVQIFALVFIVVFIAMAMTNMTAVYACEQAPQNAPEALKSARTGKRLAPNETPQIDAKAPAKTPMPTPAPTPEPTPEPTPIQDADALAKTLNEIDAELQTRIDDVLKRVKHDALVIRYIGSPNGHRINNWPDIVAVCCAIYDKAPNDLDPDDIKSIWRDMTAITYSQDASTYQDEDGYDVSCNTLCVSVAAAGVKTACEMYDLTAEKTAHAMTLMETPDFYYTVKGVIGDSIVQANAMRVVHLSLTAEQYANEFLRIAATRLGDPYSQPMRGKENYVDCSYLVWWTMRQTGAYDGEGFPSTAYRQAEWCWQRDMEILPGNLEIGDLVFYTYPNSDGTWKRTNPNDVPESIKHVSHVAIYAGEGKIIEAIGVGVTYSDLGNPTFCAALFR